MFGIRNWRHWPIDFGSLTAENLGLFCHIFREYLQGLFYVVRGVAAGIDDIKLIPNLAGGEVVDIIVVVVGEDNGAGGHLGRVIIQKY